MVVFEVGAHPPAAVEARGTFTLPYVGDEGKYGEAELADMKKRLAPFL